MRPPRDDLDPTLAELLRRAYARTVDVDTAARHLWRIDAAARAARRASRATKSRRAVVSLLTSLMVVASSGAAVAASSATLPGDALYVVKRGTERVHLVLAADAQVYLAIARRRWEEAQRAAGSRPAAVPGLLKETLVALDAAERDGGAVAEQAVALRRQVRDSSGQVAFGGERPPPPAPAAVEHAPQPESAPPVPPPAAPEPDRVEPQVEPSPVPTTAAPAPAATPSPEPTPEPTPEPETTTPTVAVPPPAGQEPRTSDNEVPPPATNARSGGDTQSSTAGETQPAVGAGAQPQAGQPPQDAATP